MGKWLMGLMLAGMTVTDLTDLLITGASFARAELLSGRHPEVSNRYSFS